MTEKLESKYPGGVWRTVRGHKVYIKADGMVADETKPQWMRDKQEQAVLNYKDADAVALEQKMADTFTAQIKEALKDRHSYETISKLLLAVQKQDKKALLDDFDLQDLEDVHRAVTATARDNYMNAPVGVDKIAWQWNEFAERLIMTAREEILNDLKDDIGRYLDSYTIRRDQVEAVFDILDNFISNWGDGATDRASLGGMADRISKNLDFFEQGEEIAEILSQMTADGDSGSKGVMAKRMFELFDRAEPYVREAMGDDEGEDDGNSVTIGIRRASYNVSDDDEDVDEDLLEERHRNALRRKDYEEAGDDTLVEQYRRVQAGNSQGGYDGRGKKGGIPLSETDFKLLNWEVEEGSVGFVDDVYEEWRQHGKVYWDGSMGTPNNLRRVVTYADVPREWHDEWDDDPRIQSKYTRTQFIERKREQTIEDYLNKYGESACRGVSAVEIDGEVQGMFSYHYNPLGKHLYIEYLETAPYNRGQEARYKGVGTALMAKAIRFSEEYGGEGRVKLSATESASPFYRKIGMEEYGSLYFEFPPNKAKEFLEMVRSEGLVKSMAKYTIEDLYAWEAEHGVIAGKPKKKPKKGGKKSVTKKGIEVVSLSDLVKSTQDLPAGGTWRTIRGAKVYIKDGEVIAGAEGKLSGKVDKSEAVTFFNRAGRRYSEGFMNVVEKYKDKRFRDLVKPEVLEAGDRYLTKGQATGYNVTRYEVGFGHDFVEHMNADDQRVIYNMYTEHVGHGMELLQHLQKEGLEIPYAVSVKASAVEWDENWKKEAEAEYETKNGKLIGRTAEYAIVFRPENPEQTEKLANLLTKYATKKGEKPIAHSWDVPDIRATGKVKGYKKRTVNTKQVAGQDLIIMTKNRKFAGFEHNSVYLFPGFAEFIKSLYLYHSGIDNTLMKAMAQKTEKPSKQKPKTKNPAKGAKQELPDGGVWRTIRGARVYIKDGEVIAGAGGKLSGRKLSALNKEHKIRQERKAKRDAKAQAKAEQGAPAGKSAGKPKPMFPNVDSLEGTGSTDRLEEIYAEWRKQGGDLFFDEAFPRAWFGAELASEKGNPEADKHTARVLNDKSGKPAGVSYTIAQEDCVYMQYCEVAPIHRGEGNNKNREKGIGIRLVAEAIQESVARGFNGKVRITSLSRQETQDFYKKLGFKQVQGLVYEIDESTAQALLKAVQERYGSGGADVVMQAGGDKWSKKPQKVTKSLNDSAESKGVGKQFDWFALEEAEDKLGGLIVGDVNNLVRAKSRKTPKPQLFQEERSREE